jgi:hypothetical protein
MKTSSPVPGMHKRPSPFPGRASVARWAILGSNQQCREVARLHLVLEPTPLDLEHVAHLFRGELFDVTYNDIIARSAEHADNS